MLGVVELPFGETALTLFDQGVCKELLIGDLVEEQDSLKKLFHLVLQWDPTQLLSDVASVHKEKGWVLSDLQVKTLKGYLNPPLGRLGSAICPDES